MNILEKIILDKKTEILKRKKEEPMSSLSNVYKSTPCFINALTVKPIGFIAEIKRKSPSAGILCTPFNPVEILQSYEEGGATAISCLIDNKYFGGSDEIFRTIRNKTNLPMLYKEFVVDEWQIAHAKSLGASGILLIAGVLDNKEITELSECAKNYGLTALIEVHDHNELNRVLDIGANCIGINNRNLKTFQTSLETTINLFKKIPDDIIVVSESGIKTADDMLKIKQLGINAVLVGETLLKDNDPSRSLKNLLSKI